MKYGKKHFKKMDDVFLGGSGNGDDPDQVAYDLALLVHSNHTIVTQGSFTMWAALLCGGDVLTKYGLISQSAAVNTYDIGRYF